MENSGSLVEKVMTGEVEGRKPGEDRERSAVMPSSARKNFIIITPCMYLNI